MFGAACDFALHAMQGHLRLELRDDVIDIQLAIAALFIELGGDGFVSIGFEIAKRPVFHFPFDLPHAEPIRQRRKQLARLLAQSLARGRIGRRSTT